MTKYLYLLSTLFIAYSAKAKDNQQVLFAKNQNQWTEQVRYRADLPGGAVFLTPSGFTYSYYSTKDLERIHDLKHHKKDVSKEPVHMHAYRVSFLNGNPSPAIEASGMQTFHYNYFLGNDQSKWASKVPVFKAVSYKDVYKGIDAKVYSNGTSMKYDFIVGASADPGQIALQFEGVQPRLTEKGDIVLRTTVATIVEQAPYAYQHINGRQVRVACRYALSKDGLLKFDFPKGYDRSRELIIDPTLVFATFSGSTASTWGFSATYDTAGCLYAGGEVFAAGWPVTTGAYQTTFGTAIDAGLNKYSSNGSTLIYSTYYGGSGTDLPNNMFVNHKNQLVVTGSTSSLNLPVTTGCYDNSYNGGNGDIFVARFSDNGSALLGATYVGGTLAEGNVNSSISNNYGDQNRGDLYTDASGNIIVCASTFSSDFPTTSGAAQTTFGGTIDGVVFKVDSNCSNLMFSTFLGGSLEDACFSLAKTTTNDIVVVGGTESTNYPTTTGAAFATLQGDVDGFVTVLDANGSNITRSSYIGTNQYDHAFKVQVNPLDDHIWVCGQTTGAYPVSPGVYSNAGANIFIQEFSDDLSTPLLSTVIGDAQSTLIPTAFLYDNCGNIYFCGFSAGPGLPLTSNAHQTQQGGFWLSVLEPGMTNLLYATYMGGSGDHVDGGSSRFDPQGIVYHSVCTINGFTATPSSFSPANLSPGYDVASFKFNFEAAGVTAVAGFTGKDSVCVPGTINFANSSVSAVTYIWDFGDGSPVSTAVAPTHTYTAPGTYTVTLYANRPTGCITSDTAYLTVHAFKLDKPALEVKDTTVCVPGLVNFTAQVTNASAGERTFHWEPASAITSDPNQQTITGDVRLSTSFTVTVTDSIGNICKETATGTINVALKDVNNYLAFGDTSICTGDTVRLWTEGGDFFAWEPFYNISDTNTAAVLVAPTQTTVYSVLITDTLGCKKKRDVTVNLHPDPVIEASEDVIIKYGESTTIYTTGNSVMFDWTPDYNLMSAASQNPRANPAVTTTYYVLGTTAEGCKAMDSITVKVTNVIIPTAFTPNGDGRNDKFYPKPTHGNVQIMDFSVYNRWGERVFKSNVAGEGWDGMYKGTPVELGTYFYTVTYVIGRKQYVEKGDVTLVR